MPLSRWLSTAPLLRRLLRSLDEQNLQLKSISVSLERLANHLAPETPVVSEADLRSTEVRFSRDSEQVRLQDFAEKVQRIQGREPTDEEWEAFLIEAAGESR